VGLKRDLVEPENLEISIRRQCDLLGLPRSSYYYKGVGESEENLELMRKIDEQYLKTPFYGYPRMTVHLRKAGYHVNEKRVYRLMGLMGIEAIYPKKRLSVKNPEHRIYPYLLRGLKITHPNQVWSTDITYIPMASGFMYLVAVIDLYSRYILSWRLSNTLDGEFCREALNEALAQNKPTIFNTDQGSQFTAIAFTDILNQAQIQISMDGRGRAYDNIFIERFWRTLKYENVYLKQYETVPELKSGLKEYFIFYNRERIHQSLAYETPFDIYYAHKILS